MTSLKKRLDHVVTRLESPNSKGSKNVKTELEIITKLFEKSSQAHSPICCLKFHSNGTISCDYIGPLQPEQFREECTRCREKIKTILSNIDSMLKGYAQEA